MGKFFQNGRQAGWLIAVLAILAYANTLSHRYALDDGIVILENAYVKKGVAAWGTLLTTDSMEGFLVGQGYSPGEARLLAGGRYRPLSLLTHALEYSLFGPKPGPSHLVNVLLYALLCWLIFRLLHRHLLAALPFGAFVAATLFALHPIHTEVVANIKSRDEILGLLFLVLCCLALLQDTVRSRRLAWLYWGLALLSKEYALAYLPLLPLLLYSYTTLRGRALWLRVLPFGLIILGYLGLRIGLTGMGFGTTDPMAHDVLNDPYVYATADQKWGTIGYTLWLYLQKLLWPYPLSYDYSWQQISYQSLSSPLALLGWLVSLAMLALGLWRARTPWGLGLLWYLAGLALVCNVLVNVGAFFNERFLFHAGLGLFIAVGYGAGRLWQLRPALQRPVLAGLAALLLLGATGTVLRNRDWRDNETLFLADVAHAPNSAKTQKAAATELLNRLTADPATPAERPTALLALHHARRAVALHPTYLQGWQTLANIYGRLDSLPQLEAAVRELQRLDSADAKLKQQYMPYLAGKYFQAGVAWGPRLAKDTVGMRNPAARADTAAAYSRRALAHMRRSLSWDSTNAEVYYYMMLHHVALKEHALALPLMQRAVALQPTNAKYQMDLGGLAYTLGRKDIAIAAWRKTLQLDSKYEGARQGLKALGARE